MFRFIDALLYESSCQIFEMNSVELIFEILYIHIWQLLQKRRNFVLTLWNAITISSFRLYIIFRICLKLSIYVQSAHVRPRVLENGHMYIETLSINNVEFVYINVWLMRAVLRDVRKPMLQARRFLQNLRKNHREFII